MKKKLILTGLLSLFLFGAVGCQEEKKPSTTTPSISPTPSVSVPSESTPSQEESSKAPAPEVVLEPYYEGLDMNKTGKEFVNELSTIINRGAQIGTYKEAYDRLTITDEDPLNPDNVLCFYTGVSFKKGINGNDRLWNREHVWAKSHGFNDEKYDAYRDLHHLRASEITINSTRNNKDFDEAPAGSKHDEYGNKWTDDIFEPRDEVKGDVARMMFYMTVKYSSGDLKLNLVEKVPTASSKGTGEFGRLSTLLKWHEEDPVSIEESKRHEKVYEFQHNRNPFIDHPEFVANVFNVEIDLPNNNVDKSDVERVQDLIDKLPDNITKDNKQLVIDASNAYDKLSLEEKKLIKDSKLIDALIKLEELNNQESIDGVVKVDVNFDDAIAPVNGKYAQNGTIMVNDYEFFATSYYNKGSFRVGNSDKGFEVDLNKFGISDKGSYLEAKFKTENTTSIMIDVIKTYNGYGGYGIYFTEDGSNEPILIAEGNEQSGTISAKLDSPKTGYFTLVLKGVNARMDIGRYRIVTSK